MEKNVGNPGMVTGYFSNLLVLSSFVSPDTLNLPRFASNDLFRDRGAEIVICLTIGVEVQNSTAYRAILVPTHWAKDGLKL